MTAVAANAGLLARIQSLDRIPTIPAVLGPLLRYLEQPVEELDMQKVTEMIAQDGALAAQCVQMANSPLFGRWQKIDSVHTAVISLGFQRVSDIAVSCGVLNLTPAHVHGMDPVVFWKHSLGCALVCRQFARKISYPNPGKAYLAGLLHDLGIIVNLWMLPKEFGAALECARVKGIPLHEAEQEVLGFTHCESGWLLAKKWVLPADLGEVVGRHHAIECAKENAGLVALVELSDLLCRMSGMGYGFAENREVNLLEQHGFAILSEQCDELKGFDWARLTFEMESYLDEVHALVQAIYRK